MLDLDRLVADCRAAAVEPDPRGAVGAFLAPLVAAPERLVRVLGEPTKAGIELLFRSPELTIIHLVWGAQMASPPHNHNLWAAIGVYAGREDNIFWRQGPAGSPRQIAPVGAKALMAGDVCLLEADTIHSVVNPLGRLTCALQVYGGDFVGQPRQQWHDETLEAGPYDPAASRQRFAKANRLMELACADGPGARA